MLEILFYVLAILAIAIIGLIAYASKRPDTFSVQRSVAIAAPPERIYPLIANLRAMNTWNPFVASDPSVRITYGGPEAGQGAAHTWTGNRNVGEGRIEITSAEAPTRIGMRLEMVKPFKADNRIEFTLSRASADTHVTWAMSGRQPLMAKVASLFIDCDGMCGREFEKGLTSLKAIAEQQ